MNLINNINNNEFKYLTNLIFKEGINKKDAGCNKYIKIPKSVTSVGYCAFYNCQSLTYVIIPNSVTSIGYCAFYNCSLNSIQIPDSVTSIGTCAFDNCSRLTSIRILPSVTSIGYYALNNCYSLKKITIPTKFKGNMNNIFFNIFLLKVDIIYT